MAEMQLTIDGREEEIQRGRLASAPLTGSQLEILRLLADHDITSSDAGRIVHARREPPCFSCRRGACPYISTDGNEALKRLAERGLVRRIAPGLWTAWTACKHEGASPRIREDVEDLKATAALEREARG